MAKQTFLSDPRPQITIQRPIQDSTAADVISAITPGIKEVARQSQVSQFEEELFTAKEELASGISDTEGLVAERSQELFNQLDAGVPENVAIDSPEVAEFNSQIDRLAAGKVAGRLTPASHDARINDLTKQFSNRAPAFSSDFRRIAGNVKGGRGSATGFFGAFEQKERELLKAREDENKIILERNGGNPIYINDPLLRRREQRKIMDELAFQETSTITKTAYTSSNIFPNTVNTIITSFMNDQGFIDNVPSAISVLESTYTVERNKIRSGSLGTSNQTTSLSESDKRSLLKDLEEDRVLTLEKINNQSYKSFIDAGNATASSLARLDATISNPVLLKMEASGITFEALNAIADTISSKSAAELIIYEEIMGPARGIFEDLQLDAVSGKNIPEVQRVLQNMVDGTTPGGDSHAKMMGYALMDRVSTREAKNKTIVNNAAEYVVQEFKGTVPDLNTMVRSDKIWNEFTNSPGGIDKFHSTVPIKVMTPVQASLPENWTLEYSNDAKSLIVVDDLNRIVEQVSFGGFTTPNRRGRSTALPGIEEARKTLRGSRETATRRVPARGGRQVSRSITNPVRTEDLENLLKSVWLMENKNHKADPSILDSGTWGEDIIRTINVGSLTGVVSTDISNVVNTSVDMSGTPTEDADISNEASDERAQAGKDQMKRFEEMADEDRKRLEAIREDPDLSAFIDQFLSNREATV